MFKILSFARAGRLAADLSRRERIFDDAHNRVLVGDHYARAANECMWAAKDLHRALRDAAELETTVVYLYIAPKVGGLVGPDYNPCPDCGGSGEDHSVSADSDPQTVENYRCGLCDGEGVLAR